MITFSHFLSVNQCKLSKIRTILITFPEMPDFRFFLRHVQWFDYYLKMSITIRDILRCSLSGNGDRWRSMRSGDDDRLRWLLVRDRFDRRGRSRLLLQGCKVASRLHQAAKVVPSIPGKLSSFVERIKRWKINKSSQIFDTTQLQGT